MRPSSTSLLISLGLTAVYLPDPVAHLQVSLNPLGVNPRLGFLLLRGNGEEEGVKYLGERWTA